MTNPIIDILESINSKNDDEIILSQYKPFLINRYLSNFKDLIPLVKEMNKYLDMDVELQYDFYFHSVPKKRRNFKWNKTNIDDGGGLEAVKEYYQVNNKRAMEYLEILTDEQIDLIKKKIYKGEKFKLKDLKNMRTKNEF